MRFVREFLCMIELVIKKNEMICYLHFTFFVTVPSFIDDDVFGGVDSKIGGNISVHGFFNSNWLFLLGTRLGPRLGHAETHHNNIKISNVETEQYKFLCYPSNLVAFFQPLSAMLQKSKMVD